MGISIKCESATEHWQSTRSQSNTRTTMLIFLAMTLTTSRAFFMPSAELSSAAPVHVARSQTSSFHQFQRGDHEERGDRRKEHFKAMESLRTRLNHWLAVPHRDLDQEKIDKYLEFLDKRYHRIHDLQAIQPTKPVVKFSVWHWLMDSSGSDFTQVEHQNENALYVLGVAGMASNRLLQKTNPERSRGQSPANQIVIDKLRIGSVIAAGAKFFARCDDQLTAWTTDKIKQCHRAFQLVCAELRSNPKFLLVACQVGGCNKAIALTLAILSAAFFLVRSLLIKWAAKIITWKGSLGS